MATNRGEKIIVIEVVIAELLVTIKEISAGRVPRPSQYIASLFIFAILGGMAAYSQGASNLASTFGGVVILGVLLNDFKDNPTFLQDLVKFGSKGFSTATQNQYYNSGGGNVASSLQQGQSPQGEPLQGGNLAQAIILSAKNWVGTPYTWGGTSRSGVDCSGFVQLVYQAVGISLPRTSEMQASQGQPVASLDKAIPGDLVFFDSDG